MADIPSTSAATSLQSSPRCYFKPNRKGQSLRSHAKQAFLNFYSKIRETKPHLTAEEAVDETAKFAGVSPRSVFAAKREWRSSAGVLRTPGKKRPRKKGNKRVDCKCDSFVCTAVRGIVHKFFFKNEPPSLDAILCAVNSDPDLPDMSKSTLYRVMKEIGFRFNKRNRNSLLIEKNEIVAWRHKYLRTVRQYRREGLHIIYLDETWVNAGHTVQKCWTDTTVTSSKNAFLRGLSPGLKEPSGRGSRLICVHAGSEEGFVNGALLLFQSKGTGDYHQEMNGPCFEGWFEGLLKLIPPSSVIVMDNAAYHSVRAEAIPTSAWKKEDIRTWLTSKGIQWQPEQLKQELLVVVKHEKPRFIAYRADVLAAAAGHTVLRLPPYHAELNPIELAWSQVKGHVARCNTNFKICDVKKLFEDGVSRVSSPMWKSFIDHTIRKEDEFWRHDLLTENAETDVHVPVASSLLINLDTSSDSDGMSDIESFSDDETPLVNK